MTKEADKKNQWGYFEFNTKEDVTILQKKLLQLEKFEAHYEADKKNQWGYFKLINTKENLLQLEKFEAAFLKHKMKLLETILKKGY